MIVSADTKLYNMVFQKQYRNLMKFSKDDSDNVHDSYLKTLNRITEKGFTAHTINELQDKLKIYIKTVIYNGWKTNQKLKKNTVDIGWETEVQLQKYENICKDERMYYDELEFITMKLFEYLKKYHSQEDNYVYRVYYLYDHNNRKITYKQLSEITGYSVSKVCGIVQKLKQDLKANLIGYINGIESKSC